MYWPARVPGPVWVKSVRSVSVKLAPFGSLTIATCYLLSRLMLLVYGKAANTDRFGAHRLARDGPLRPAIPGPRDTHCVKDLPLRSRHDNHPGGPARPFRPRTSLH